ncbi:TetR/AcrR family transcriptional regulator [uncultured Paracoccus sp.]|uniref:TetR/AcrR family transcriptional regulator n=1 Tax=uncultured Paracoccus sp. TaxID=189685 RepID=UPI0025F9EB6D|nr:TetR/AcrR family transcriptional regulator [uncultured Paracoccus sp.]
MTQPPASPAPRKRLKREQRLAQLMDLSWRLVREEGTDALTLGRLADAAGVTKPVVYDHFGTRHGLLAALYRDFDLRQGRNLEAALAQGKPDADSRARLIAAHHIGCVTAEGRELPDVVAALSSSPELATIKRECQTASIEKYGHALAPFMASKTLPKAALWAILGAADSLSNAVLAGEATEGEAHEELYELIMAAIRRN